MNSSPVRRLLEEAIRLRIGSGIAASYGHLSDLKSKSQVHDHYLGKTSHLAEADSISARTHFDLASLTKILATTTLAMVKRQKGELNLDANLESLLPEACAKNTNLSPITVRSLLAHASGLPAWKPFYEQMRTEFGDTLPWVSLAQRRSFFDSKLYAEVRESEVGEKVIYSDLGFLILEQVLSRQFEKEINEVWSRIPELKFHFRPVNCDSETARFEIKKRKESIAMTELCPWRGLLQGQVHDDNCWSRGGVAGHAGVFGRLEDVKLWTSAIFSLAIVNEATLREFTSEVEGPIGARRGLGFDLSALDGSGSTGFLFSKNTVGHLGFTGTSLWVDLDSGLYAILLTNRVHPDRNDIRIRALRREFHQLVRGELRHEFRKK